MMNPALTIRAATPGDADSLSRLAALGYRRCSRGHALLAEREGVVIAAIALTSGSVLAHPSKPTGEAVRMLRHRRYRILRQGGDVARAQSLLRRLAASVPA